MALISTWLHSSSATFASGCPPAFRCGPQHSSAQQEWTQWGSEQAQARPTLLPSSCSLLGHLPHPFRTPSSQQLTIFYQHKPRTFGLAHSPSLVGPG